MTSSEKTYETIIRVLGDNPLNMFGRDFLRDNYQVVVKDGQTKEEVYQNLKTKLGIVKVEVAPLGDTEEGVPVAPAWEWRNGQLFYVGTTNRVSTEVEVAVRQIRTVSSRERWGFDGTVEVYLDDVLSDGEPTPSEEALRERIREQALYEAESDERMDQLRVLDNETTDSEISQGDSNVEFDAEELRSEIEERLAL